jgi:hypothetical protein
VVGAGFEPCTRTASFYDVPQEVPIIRFLDTRGLDEADYDPANGYRLVRGTSRICFWCVIAGCRPFARARAAGGCARHGRRHPDWPLVVAQTGLHRLLSGGRPPP